MNEEVSIEDVTAPTSKANDTVSYEAFVRQKIGLAYMFGHKPDGLFKVEMPEGIIARFLAYVYIQTKSRREIKVHVDVPRPTFMEWLLREPKRVTVTIPITIDEVLVNPPPHELGKQNIVIARIEGAEIE